MWHNIFNVCLKITLPLPVWPRDAKSLDSPERDLKIPMHFNFIPMTINVILVLGDFATFIIKFFFFNNYPLHTLKDF